MTTAQAISIPSLKIKEKIIVFSVLAALTAYLPTVIHIQMITGPLVNMSLILALFLIGSEAAILLALAPSVLALSSGLLPLPLAPVVPFIMISNIILIGVYHYLGRKKFGVSIFLAGGLKFLFLYSVTNLLLTNLLPAPLAVNLAAMMGSIQFVTALTGGLLAYGVLKALKK